MKKSASCEGVNCPLGDICFEGDCYSPGELYAFSGYVMDHRSLELPYVTVSTPWNTNTKTGPNGYFSIRIPFQQDSLLLRFDKQDYGAVGQYIYPESENFIVLGPLDVCHGVTCPLGQVCYQGSCYTPSIEGNNLEPCEDVSCPLGMVCFDGSCYEPCILDSELCYNPENPCDGVECPLGMVCYEGSCYDPCVIAESSPGMSCSGYEDPCDAISVQPGYICQDGVLIPKCPENVLACAVSDPCGVINCPPGEDCFQCFDATGYNTSGTALIQGVLSDGLLKSGDDVQMQPQGVYLYLRDARTDRNVAIARTDEDGRFLFENLPAADYLLFVVLPGYFISEDEQLITVGAGNQLQLDITSRDAFLETDITPLTAVEAAATGRYSKWYPSPNKGTHFYLDDAGHIDMVELFHISGRKILTQIQGGAGTTVVLTIEQKLPPGFYIIRWKNTEDQFPKSQTLVVRY